MNNNEQVASEEHERVRVNELCRDGEKMVHFGSFSFKKWWRPAGVHVRCEVGLHTRGDVMGYGCKTEKKTYLRSFLQPPLLAHGGACPCTLQGYRDSQR